MYTQYLRVWPPHVVLNQISWWQHKRICHKGTVDHRALFPYDALARLVNLPHIHINRMDIWSRRALNSCAFSELVDEWQNNYTGHTDI